MKTLYKRTWLAPNTIDEESCVITNVTLEDWGDGEVGIISELKIRDCARTVALDFDAATDLKRAKKKLKKLDKLIVALMQMRTAYGEAMVEMEATND